MPDQENIANNHVRDGTDEPNPFITPGSSLFTFDYRPPTSSTPLPPSVYPRSPLKSPSVFAALDRAASPPWTLGTSPRSPLTPRRNALWRAAYDGSPTMRSPRFWGRQVPPAGHRQYKRATTFTDSTARAKRVRRTPEAKIKLVMEALDDINWTLADLLYYFFRIKDEQGEPSHRELPHANAVSRFLRGRTVHTFAEILDHVWHDPLGRPQSDSEQTDLMYSSSVPYIEIRCARPAISSFCVQVTTAKLLRERNRAVRGVSGLHGSGRGARRGGQRSITWDDIGSESVSTVTSIFKEYQPLTWNIMTALVTPKSRKSNGRVTARKRRPPDVVAAELISSINFAHSWNARLLPAARSILYFACGAQETLFKYSSRIGHTSSWKTTYRMLKRLAAQRAREIKDLGRDPSRGIFMRIDNVQQYFKQWENRVGRENQMKIGISGYVAEAVDYDSAAINLDDAHAKIKENLRSKLTVEKLLDLVDWEHQETVGSLQWLSTLVKCVPSLEYLRPKVAELYRTKGAKKLLPSARKTKIWPLATSGKNETITTKLRDAMHDFLNQLGQTKESRTPRRPIYTGGDGMTFEKELNLKLASQFLSDPFNRGDDMKPFLEIWHTEWTYMGLVFQVHWGDSLTEDPSKLGHSATKLGQKAPSNIKKPDYYPAAYLLYTVLDARMLDCWRIHFQCDDLKTYFARLDENKDLPSIDQLEATAKILYRRYSSQRAYYQALFGHPTSDTEMRIPCGTPWEPPLSQQSSRSKTGGSKSAPRKKSAGLTLDQLEEAKEYKGDQVLAHSIMFMHDAILAREMAMAVPEGDPGRVYEAMKRTMFAFWGSDHARYAKYTLEEICDLEYESTEAMKDMFLSNWLINPEGEPGGYTQGDTYIEHQNLELQKQMGHKDMEWDGVMSRQVVSPNVDKLSEIKNKFHEGTGLAKRRKTHTSPHSRPEYAILSRAYHESELHLFRSGRRLDSVKELDVNSFSKGIRELQNGKLQKWIRQTTRMRVLHEGEPLDTRSATNEDHEEEEDVNDEADDENITGLTRGRTQLVEGDLLVLVNDEGVDNRTPDSDDDWETDNEPEDYEL